MHPTTRKRLEGRAIFAQEQAKWGFDLIQRLKAKGQHTPKEIGFLQDDAARWSKQAQETVSKILNAE